MSVNLVMPRPPGYLPRRMPWRHQVEALERLKERKFFALLMAMRTGKTKVVLDDFGRCELEGKVEDLLVIAPAGVYRTWESAAIDHLSQDLLSRLKVLVWRSGEGSQKAKERLSWFLGSRDTPRMLLMNVEALSTVQEARSLVLSFASQRKTMIVVDESTVIKNPRSKRSRFVVEKLAPLGSMRRILSGLPTPRSPLDLFGQFEFLEKQLLGHSTFFSFRSRYAIMKRMQLKGKRPFDVVVGFQNLEDLKDKIKPYSFRVTLEDCYDLPPKLYSMREVGLTPDQRRIYYEVRDKATSELNAMAHVTATAVVSRILRCHQVLCGHVRDEHGVLHSIPEKRTDALLELLEEHDGKAVIWCSYDYNVDRIAEALKSHFEDREIAARFWGGNLNTREEEERRFKEDPRCRYMVATPGAGGRGRTWVMADLVVYFSNVDNLEHRNQSEERTQGIDKVKSVAYVDLMAPGTVDERIIKALRRKIDMAATITGDNWKEWLI